MARIQNLSSYGVFVQQQQKRRALADKALSQADNLRSAFVSNINSVTQGQVDLTAKVLRTKSADAAKAKLNTLNKIA